MAQNEPKLFTTPVSVNDGFKRSDSTSWAVIGIIAVVAIVAAVLIDTFFEKPKIAWPTSPPPKQAVPPTSDTEKTYDVAPRGAVPAKPR
jgi:hypothetical protein